MLPLDFVAGSSLQGGQACSHVEIVVSFPHFFEEAGAEGPGVMSEADKADESGRGYIPFYRHRNHNYCDKQWALS